MPDLPFEAIFLDYDNRALNFPGNFLKDLEANPLANKLEPEARKLLKIRAMLSLGKLEKAGSEVNSLYRSMDKSASPFLLAKLLMLDYILINHISQNHKKAAETLNKAEKVSKRANSQVLDCEIMISRCLAEASQYDLTFNEDILNKAMRIATKADSVECMIKVHLSSIVLYHNQQLPDSANRELQMLQEICPSQSYPYFHAQMLNHLSVNSLMLRNYSQAENTLVKGIELCIKHGYKLILGSLLINRGILDKQQGRFQYAIEHYRMACTTLEECGAQDSELAEKAMDNLGLALGMNGEIDEAIQMMQGSLQRARKLAIPNRESVVSVNLADLLIEKEDFEEAKVLLNRAIDHLNSIKSYGHLQNAWLCKARLYETREKYQEAFECMEELHQVTQLHFNTTINRQAEKLTRRIDDLRKEYMLIRSKCNDNASRMNKLLETTMIGDHPKIKNALSMAMQAAKYPYVNVLISGESGTGKEIIARLIHANSPTDKPMVALNASALPANLMESELFGHVRGAFTGAYNDHKGKFALADQSTLFLDEISEMPLELQAKLLRAIENHSVMPVGGNKEMPVHCRIICATNRRMSELIHRNQFRLDLYHRLNKVEIVLPPLRDRLSDLELLTEHFIRRCAKEFGLPVPTIEDGFYVRLKQYHFPGNIRELMNIIERIFILKPRMNWDISQLDGLVEDSSSPVSEPDSIQANLEQTEYQMIKNALQKSKGVQKEAARMLGMTESTLSRHIKRLGISK